MSVYQFNYILSPKISEENLQAWENKFEKTIEAVGGKVAGRNAPKQERLGYELKHETTGFRGSIEFETAQTEKVPSILETLRHETDVLRIVLVKKMAFKKIAPRRTRKPQVASTAEARPEAPQLDTVPREPASITTENAQPLPAAKKVEFEELDKRLEELLG